jgi:hypothetical protein
MSWNYRVLKRRHSDDEVTYGIHEVYYDKQGNPSFCSTNPMEPFGSTFKDLNLDFSLMRKAFKLPVLNYQDFISDKKNKKHKK